MGHFVISSLLIPRPIFPLSPVPDLQVCDSVMNIGPCGQVEMGEPAFLSEEFSATTDPDLELVTTSGYGKNGAISVLQVIWGG